MRLEVLYFAGAREAVGRPSDVVDVPDGTTVAALRGALATRHPALARLLPSARLAVGERFAPESRPLADGDVVALIPPVSGG
jgi:molybdopterin converting factor subunit 1